MISNIFENSNIRFYTLREVIAYDCPSILTDFVTRRVFMEESGYNVIGDLKYVKTSVNWPPEYFHIIKRIADIEYDGVVGQYIRRTIKHDLRQRGLIGANAQAELFPEYTPYEIEKHKIGVKWVNRPACDYVDPPRKFLGFIGGLRRSQFVYRWFVRKAGKYRIKNNEKEIDSEKKLF
jgi:hypothetical protein